WTTTRWRRWAVRALFHSLDEDERALGRASANLTGPGVLGRVVPGPGGIGVGELDHHHAPGIEVAFEHLGLAAADDVVHAVLVAGDRSELAVFVVGGRIGDVD